MKKRTGITLLLSTFACFCIMAPAFAATIQKANHDQTIALSPGTGFVDHANVAANHSVHRDMSVATDWTQETSVNGAVTAFTQACTATNDHVTIGLNGTVNQANNATTFAANNSVKMNGTIARTLTTLTVTGAAPPVTNLTAQTIQVGVNLHRVGQANGIGVPDPVSTGVTPALSAGIVATNSIAAG